MRTTIILDPGEPEVQQVRDLVKVILPGSWSHLFTNQAMQLVRHVALASMDGQPFIFPGAIFRAKRFNQVRKQY